jgi:hypothetical protein
MGEEKNTLMLLELIFVEGAEVVQHGASERLILWARAYDEWMEEQGRSGDG